MTTDPTDEQAAAGEEVGEAGTIDDPNDLIVGSLRPPGWLARIPTLGWLLVALAALDVTYRLWNDFRFGPDEPSPSTLVSLILLVISAAATVLLPAAVLVGFHGPGRARSWLLQGAVALAAAELLRLVAWDALTAVFGPAALDPESSSLATDYVGRLFVVFLPVLALRLFGLAKIGLGLGSIEAPGRPLGRTVWTLIVASLAAVLVGVGLTLQSFGGGAQEDAELLAYNLLVVAAGPIVAGLWAWIVSIAARRDGGPWRAVLAGALAILLGIGMEALGGLLTTQLAGTYDALTILTWSGLVAGALGAFGAVVMVVAFARGLEAINDEGPDVAPVKDVGAADAQDRPTEA
jgi:hypothetical protein